MNEQSKASKVSRSLLGLTTSRGIVFGNIIGGGISYLWARMYISKMKGEETTRREEAAC